MTIERNSEMEIDQNEFLAKEKKWMKRNLDLKPEQHLKLIKLNP